jgi:hypothetical protein
MAGIQQVSFTSPYSAEEADIQRRRAMAEALQAQGQQGLGPTEMVGGWAIPKSPWEGLGKAAQQVSGAYQQKQLRGEEKALGERAQAEKRSTLADALRLAEGTPRTYTDAADNVYGTPQDAVAPNMRAALLRMADSNDPMLSAAGTQGVLSQFVPKEAKWHVVNGNLVQEPTTAGGKSPTAAFTAPHWVKVEGVDAQGRPQTQWVNQNSQTAPGATAAPMSGLMGQLQQMGVVPPGTPLTPEIQQVLSGYLAKEGGLITPKDAAEIKIKLGHLANEGIKIGLQRADTQFTTGSMGMGGGAAVPVAPQQFNAFAPTQNPAAPYNAPPPAAPQGQPVPRMPQQGPQPVARQPVPVQQGAVPPGASPLTPAARSRIAEDAGKKEAEATAAAKVQLPQTIASAQQAIDHIDAMIGDQDKGGAKSPHGGFGQFVGAGIPGLQYVPGTDTASFKKMHNQILGGAFMQAYQSLKGGGQITEIEGKKATEAITRLDSSQSEKEYIKAAREFQDILRTGVERARKAAKGDFSAGGASGGWKDL